MSNVSPTSEVLAWEEMTEKAKQTEAEEGEIFDTALIHKLAKIVQEHKRISSAELLQHMPQLYQDNLELAQDLLIQLVFHRFAVLEISTNDEYFFMPVVH